MLSIFSPFITATNAGEREEKCAKYHSGVTDEMRLFLRAASELKANTNTTTLENTSNAINELFIPLNRYYYNCNYPGATVSQIKIQEMLKNFTRLDIEIGEQLDVLYGNVQPKLLQAYPGEDQMSLILRRAKAMKENE